MSPLDWALVESWKNAGVPLEAVMRGIDSPSRNGASRKVKTQMVNSLAFCAQAVLTEAKIMAGAAPPRRESAPPFPLDDLRAYLAATPPRSEPQFPEIAGVPAQYRGRRTRRSGSRRAAPHRPRREDDRDARARQSEEELLLARQDLDRQLRPYRGKMTAEQLTMLEKQYLERNLSRDRNSRASACSICVEFTSSRRCRTDRRPSPPCRYRSRLPAASRSGTRGPSSSFSSATIFFVFASITSPEEDHTVLPSMQKVIQPGRSRTWMFIPCFGGITVASKMWMRLLHAVRQPELLLVRRERDPVARAAVPLRRPGLEALHLDAVQLLPRLDVADLEAEQAVDVDEHQRVAPVHRERPDRIRERPHRAHDRVASSGRRCSAGSTSVPPYTRAIRPARRSYCARPTWARSS